MSRYHVSFFKNLLSSDGHPFKCLQRRIDVNGRASLRIGVKGRSKGSTDVPGSSMRIRSRL
jgi:hypothetical protein